MVNFIDKSWKFLNLQAPKILRMPFVDLKIPTMVMDTKIEGHTHFLLRPLFIPHPVIIHRRYDSAISIYQKEIKHAFKGFVLGTENAHELFWFNFTPEIKYHKFYFAFTIKNKFLEGNFGVAVFQLKELSFACLPAFNNFIFLLGDLKKEKINIESKTETVIPKLIKQLAEEQGNAFDPDSYFSGKKDFLTFIDVGVHIRDKKFRTAHQAPPGMQFHSEGEEEFDGGLELEKTGYDLTINYPSSLRRAYFQDAIVQKIHDILFVQAHTPVALVGPDGVGKHSILTEAIFQHYKNHEGKDRNNLQSVWHIDPTRIISGMSIVGQWQKRLEAMIKFICDTKRSESRRDIMLIDNVSVLPHIGVSGSNAMSLTDIFKPHLEKRQFPMILLANNNQWKILQEKDRSFCDLFQVFRIREPDMDDAIKMILKQRKILESEKNTVVTIQAINQLLAIHRNYLKHQALPGSIMKLLEQLAVKYNFNVIDAPEVRQEFKAFSGLEEHIFTLENTFKEREVQKTIRRDLVGQNQAVEALSKVVHLLKAKLADKNKPVSSLLFIGPTGVGKTHAAKTLCHYLMGDENQLIRFDMNEFIDEFAVNRLIGDYYKPEGLLTGKIRYQPFGVLLLDEIEKAHPDVLDLFLQVLDDGRLTDSLGRTADFSNTIIIMTSNIGAEDVQRQLGFETPGKDNAAIYRKAVENFFRPEFINRIDEVVVFNPLKLDHILNIARLQIKELLKRDGFVRRTTMLNVSQEVLEWVAQRGYNSKMGGRALKRQIERDLTTLTAEQLITSTDNNPILFDISLKNNKLVPRISPIEFTTPLQESIFPELPDLDKGRAFYGSLLNRIKAIAAKIKATEASEAENIDIPKSDVSWQQYHFKNRLVETQDKVQNILLGFSDRYYMLAPAIPLRLKRANFIQRNDWTSKGFKLNSKDIAFQKEGLQEISDDYRFGTAHFDSLKTEFIDHFLNVAFLHLASRAFLNGKWEKIIITFKSLITGLGKGQIDYLLNAYTDFFEMLDFSYERDIEKKEIRVEGYGISDLLRGETGIHLFYIDHQNPLPIKVSLAPGKSGSKNTKPLIVIRIYDGFSTLTDLRTGFSNDAYATPGEWKLLVYGGIDAKLRKRIRSF